MYIHKLPNIDVKSQRNKRKFEEKDKTKYVYYRNNIRENVH